MPATQHAPPPISLPRDDRPSPTTISTTSAAATPPASQKSPIYSRPNDVKPVVQQQLRNSPPPSSKPQPSAAQTDSPKSPIPQHRKTPEPEPAPQPPVQEKDEPPPDDVIDMETFGQLLELDEDDPDFSKGMAWEYFSQAETTFKQLDDALKLGDLAELSSLGHYLKGSSAALGLCRVQQACEKIQHYGQLRDEDAQKDLKGEEALTLIDKTLASARKEYAVAEKWLKNYYKDEEGS